MDDVFDKIFKDNTVKEREPNVKYTLNELEIKAKLGELLSTLIPQDIYSTTIHHAKCEVVGWLYNDGNYRTDDEIDTKLTTLEDTVNAYNITGIGGFMLKAAEDSLREFKHLIF